MHRFVLTLSCPDRTGIVAAVSGFLLEHECNIVDSAQFGDARDARFFMRVCFDDARNRSLRELESEFAAVGERFSMQWSLHDVAVKARVLVMVSKFGRAPFRSISKEFAYMSDLVDRIVELARGASIELNVQDAKHLQASRAHLAAGTRAYISHMPKQTWSDTLAACLVASKVGFDPIPHLPVRLIEDETALDRFLAQAVLNGVREVLVQPCPWQWETARGYRLAENSPAVEGSLAMTAAANSRQQASCPRGIPNQRWRCAVSNCGP